MITTRGNTSENEVHEYVTVIDRQIGSGLVGLWLILSNKCQHVLGWNMDWNATPGMAHMKDEAQSQIVSDKLDRENTSGNEVELRKTSLL